MGGVAAAKFPELFGRQRRSGGSAPADQWRSSSLAFIDEMSQTTPTLSPDVSVVVAHDNESAYTLSAQTIVDLAHDAVSARGKFTIALSGGSTPKKLYELLASPAWQP